MCVSVCGCPCSCVSFWVVFFYYKLFFSVNFLVLKGNLNLTKFHLHQSFVFALFLCRIVFLQEKIYLIDLQIGMQAVYINCTYFLLCSIDIQFRYILYIHHFEPLKPSLLVS